MMEKIKRFFGEARQELRHVNWPTRKEAIRLTTIVIGISIGLALFLGVFDFAFTAAVKDIVLRGAATAPAGDGIVITPEDIEASTTTENANLEESAGMEAENGALNISQ